MLIVIALGAVALGIVQKFSHPAPQPAAGVGEAFALPAGARIVEMQTSGNRMALRLRVGDHDEIDIVDLADGHLIARIR
ncbi:MAG: hypothetical protein JOZ72_18285 [Alphaproteobacteria bacterium]|nr:hypothetical protein [Alphaproteobacteria bacterium]